MNYGFVRVAAAVPDLKVGNCDFNAGEIIKAARKADSQGAQFVVFPELSVTSYTCGDLFLQTTLLKRALSALETVISETAQLGCVIILGMPLALGSRLYNCAVIIKSGRILGVVPKCYIPNYSEFYEARWFSSGLDKPAETINILGNTVPFGFDILFEAENVDGLCFGIEICEDLWVPIPPSCNQALNGATLLFNLSASNDIVGKHEYREELIKMQSAKCSAAYVYVSSGPNESTTDLVFGGHSLISEYGSVLAQTERFSFDEKMIISDIDIQRLVNERFKNSAFKHKTNDVNFRKVPFTVYEHKFSKLLRWIDPNPFVPSDSNARNKRCEEIFNIQTSGLGKRLKHTGLDKCVIGISGGLDSTLALLVIVKTYDRLGLDRKNIHAVTMPGFGTSANTLGNSLELMRLMNVTTHRIDIKEACLKHFEDIGHDPLNYDVTYENVQARERTQILMDMANKIGGLVIGTGDLSELALGWATYNGDHMSMYGVNSGVPKTLVKYLVQWCADYLFDNDIRNVLLSVLDTPISPELLPTDKEGCIQQKTEDIVGPYELHDFYLYHLVRYGAEPDKIYKLAEQAFEGKYEKAIIKKWLETFLRRFFSQQFKRSCLPDGPKVGSISLSPRGDWRMPSDADVGIWLNKLTDL
ncbi:NAD(+) synthase [Ruminiclostridium josui]|uniref:NAD(+) synthase n=1 Tax=Ruminiclostridium josui TaxID=1499 RepID=UPI000463036A|nr:NAD(+) synthase [Ruminiclostridium josui]